MAVFPALSYPYNVPPRKEEIVIPTWRELEPKFVFEKPSPKTIIKTFAKKKSDFLLFSFDSGSSPHVGIYSNDYDWQQQQIIEDFSFKPKLLSADLKQPRTIIVSQRIFKEA